MKRRVEKKVARRCKLEGVRLLKRWRGVHDRATFFVTNGFWPGVNAAWPIGRYENVRFYIGGDLVAEGIAKVNVSQGEGEP